MTFDQHASAKSNHTRKNFSMGWDSLGFEFLLNRHFFGAVGTGYDCYLVVYLRSVLYLLCCYRPSRMCLHAFSLFRLTAETKQGGPGRGKYFGGECVRVFSTVYARSCCGLHKFTLMLPKINAQNNAHNSCGYF